MSSLTITYAGMTIFDGEVSAFRWDDVPGDSVTVTAQLAKPKSAAGAGGLSTIVDLFAQASKAKTAEKRRELTEQTETTTEIAEDAADD